MLAHFFQENVWKLADHVRQTAPAELSKTYVVFVSNRKQVVPLWRQRAGRDEEKVHENTLPKLCVIYQIIPKSIRSELCYRINGFICFYSNIVNKKTNRE